MDKDQPAGLLTAALLTALSWACSGSQRAVPSAVAPTPTPAQTAVLPSGPTGSYFLTLTASPSCDAVQETYTGQILPLPDAARVRRYTAEFKDGKAILKSANSAANQVNLGGVDGYAYPGRPLMTLRGNELTIVVPPEDGGGYIATSPSCAGGDYWWEVLDGSPLPGHQAFESCGTWTGTIQDSGRIEGTISGTFAYYAGTAPKWTTDLFCRASDHRFTLVKQ